MTVNIHIIAAARPNFMKVAPLYHELKRRPWCQPVMVHTGQHYDAVMSDVFFDDFGLPKPDYHLEVGSGSHAEQTANVMVKYEQLCLQDRPDMVVVVGDVNSTMAATLAAKKLMIPVGHLEAGLRSFDRTMPEELNRIVTDSIADMLWTPSPDGDQHLRDEGVADERVDRVGNIMIDTLEMMRPKFEQDNLGKSLGVSPKNYGVVTLHRPSNVDEVENLQLMADLLCRTAEKIDIIFPVHPRTKAKLEEFGLLEKLQAVSGIKMLGPVSYIPFMGMVASSRMVITDSGGIQEETTYLNIPCITLRPSTERPITITDGTNELARPDQLDAMVDKVLSGKWKTSNSIELWDGKTAMRVADSLAKFLKQ